MPHMENYLPKIYIYFAANLSKGITYSDTTMRLNDMKISKDKAI